jgi:hypothetical protein
MEPNNADEQAGVEEVERPTSMPGNEPIRDNLNVEDSPTSTLTTHQVEQPVGEEAVTSNVVDDEREQVEPSASGGSGHVIQGVYTFIIAFI